MTATQNHEFTRLTQTVERFDDVLSGHVVELLRGSPVGDDYANAVPAACAAAAILRTVPAELHSPEQADLLAVVTAFEDTVAKARRALTEAPSLFAVESGHIYNLEYAHLTDQGNGYLYLTCFDRYGAKRCTHIADLRVLAGLLCADA